MKKEISPEMYNYNKYPGPSFARVGDKVVSENIELDILEDHKDAFDQTIFGQRFSPFMLKFDYIVGDWGNEQLRLKGFYKDDKVVKSDLKIGRLEDYLIEFCNFGCAYFVLGNNNPQEPEEEIEERPRKRRNKNRNRNKTNQPSIDHRSNKKIRQEEKSSSRPKKKKEAPASKARHFTVRSEKRSDEKSLTKQPRQTTSSDTKSKRNFTIRQK